MYDVGIMGNGALAGLVAITSGTSTIEPWGAIIVGFVAGALYILGSKCSVWFKVGLLPACSPCILPAAWLHPCKLLQYLRIQSSGHCAFPGMQCAVCGQICPFVKLVVLINDLRVYITCSGMTRWTPLLCTPGMELGV